MPNTPKKAAIAIRIHFKSYHFTPKWSSLAATLILFPILISLGFWQLHRADEKRTIQAQYTARQHHAPLTTSALENTKDLRYYPIKLSGHYDTQRQLLVDNKMSNHEIGYEVLTPFILKHSHKILLVNRGWVPMGRNRQQLPDINVTTKTQKITGNIYAPSKKQFTLGKNIVTKGKWPLVVQSIELTKFAPLFNAKLYPFTARLSTEAPNGYVRHWSVINMSPYKHIGYAVQWFSFAAILFIVFIVVNLHREKRNYG